MLEGIKNIHSRRLWYMRLDELAGNLQGEAEIIRLKLHNRLGMRCSTSKEGERVPNVCMDSKLRDMQAVSPKGEFKERVSPLALSINFSVQQLSRSIC